MSKNKGFQAFPSKVLLFGEHIINKGSRGLAIPTPYFSGQFFFSKLADKSDQSSNQSLEKLAHFILKHEELEIALELNRFLGDIENGLVFDSNIPQGYGLGSSGALVAALVSAYGTNELKKNDALFLKDFMAKIESCFHGKSSGLDPIVSYLNCPIIVSATSLEKTKLKSTDATFFEVSLIDTGSPRQTSEWVNKFMNMTKDSAFGELLSMSYIPANEMCIDAFLNLKYAHFWKSLKIISQLQFQYMKEFIPRMLWRDWEDGLKYNDYYLKICGAGGGGFMLSFAKKESKDLYLQTQKKHPILNF